MTDPNSNASHDTEGEAQDEEDCIKANEFFSLLVGGDTICDDTEVLSQQQQESYGSNNNNYNALTNEALYFLHTSGFDPSVPDMDVVKDLVEQKRIGKQNLFEKRVQARTGMSSSEISENLVRKWATKLIIHQVEDIGVDNDEKKTDSTC